MAVGPVGAVSTCDMVMRGEDAAVEAADAAVLACAEAREPTSDTSLSLSTSPGRAVHEGRERAEIAFEWRKHVVKWCIGQEQEAP